MNPDPILRVALPVPVDGGFDYLAPAASADITLRPGLRVKVPFGTSTRCGILVDLVGDSAVEPARLKRALEILDREPLLGAGDLELLQWASRYYRHPLGDVLFGALPTRLRRGLAPGSDLRQGWRITPLGSGVSAAELKRAPRQAAVLEALRQAGTPVCARQLRRYATEAARVLRSLEAKGWVESCSLPAPVRRAGGAGRAGSPQLTSGQLSAVQQVLRSAKRFEVFVLDGVTGSGKTEVYLALVESVLAAGGQVLMLVPEISLTPQMVRRFERRVPGTLALLHSGLPEREREQAWLDARAGRADVVVGTRSAVFCPMPRLGLVVVDEEHDLSFKQQEGFRYSARDVSVMRGRAACCPVVLGSATPSLESLYNVGNGRYRQLILPHRAGSAEPPRVDLLDIRDVPLDAGLSPTLVRMSGEALERGEQVMLFLNRRGYAPVLSCRSCGWVCECPRCDARMVLHRSDATLWCHHCGYRSGVHPRCPGCGASDLRSLGQGTERVQEVLERRFPGVGIARVDRDSTRRKGALEAILDDIRAGRRRLLLGTQMLAKGHHFPALTLVGILDADQGLFGADFRAPERMAQLIVQVAGRAGRADRPGRVLIQTRHPEHPLLRTLVGEGYASFARGALAERRDASLPPFSFQALLRAEATRPEAPQAFLAAVLEAGNALGVAGVQLWGPVPAPMERRAGRFRSHLLLQSGDRRNLHRLIDALLPGLERWQTARAVRWSLDVDPQELL